MPSHPWLCMAALAVLLARPALALEDCSCDGKHINLNNGSYTENLTGIVKCVDRDSRKPTREIPYVKGKLQGWEKVFAHFSFDGAVVHTEYKNGEPGCRRRFTAQNVLTEEDGCEKPSGFISRVKKTFHPNGKIAVQQLFTVPAAGASEQLLERTEHNAEGLLLDLECPSMSGTDAQPNRCPALAGKTSITLHHPNGKPSQVMSLKNGLLDGESKDFDDKSALIGIDTFKAGKREGLLRRFNKEGKPYLEAHFAQDVLDGAAQCFQDDGTVCFDITWQKGVPVRQRTYFLNGQPRADVRAEEDHVKVSSFFDDGTLASESVFHQKLQARDSAQEVVALWQLAMRARAPKGLDYSPLTRIGHRPKVGPTLAAETSVATLIP